MCLEHYLAFNTTNSQVILCLCVIWEIPLTFKRETFEEIHIIMCGYIQRVSQKCCSSVVCNICTGYTEAAMELNRKGWWYCGTSISVPPPRVQMLHLRCGRLQWWEQLLCCELTGKTERMQKCQERERVTETKTEDSFPALCWRDAWSCQESLQIRVRSESRADRLGPWALRTEER